MNEIIFPPGESFSSPCVLFRFYHIALPFSYLESSLFGSVISVVVQWLRLHASSAGVTVSIPGQGTEVPHGIGHAPLPKKKKLKRHSVWIPGAFFWASLVAQMVKNLPAMQETWVRVLGQEDPLEKEVATHSSILA